MKGKIVEWNDQKGYGFIEALHAQLRVFVHISAIKNRHIRPRLNDQLCFAVRKDGPKKLRAINVTLTKRKQLPVTVFFACSYLLFAAAVAVYSASLWLIAAYLGLSVFTFIIYAWDKRAAQKGEWRISENTLHILSLAGGWPGALFAQKQLRHKSQKQPFKALLWITIVINSGAFAWSFTPPGTLFLQQLENKLLQLFWIANGLSNHLS